MKWNTAHKLPNQCQDLTLDRLHNSPQDGHVLISGTCDYLTFHGKRDWADMIKLRIGDGEIILDYPGKTTVIIRPL